MDYTNQTAGQFVVTLDGEALQLPAGRHSLNSIRSFLEMRALEKQRVLSVLFLDGEPVNLNLLFANTNGGSRIEAESISLNQLPLLLLNNAQAQVCSVREAVETAISLVLINSPSIACEVWWNIACQLKEPVLTLSLMPLGVCKACSNTSFDQLRKWQLEQIAAIVKEMDVVCQSLDTLKISDALENRVLNWLTKLDELIRLWLNALSAGYQLGVNYHAG